LLNAVSGRIIWTDMHFLPQLYDILDVLRHSLIASE
jgi:hypothetical protein